MCAKCASHLRVLLARSQNASLDRHSPLPSADRNSRQARTNFLSKLLHGIECRRQFFGHKVKHKVAGSQFPVALNCGCNVCRASSGWKLGAGGFVLNNKREFKCEGETFRISGFLLKITVQIRFCFNKELKCGSDWMPGISVPGGTLHRCLAVPCNPDGRSRLLNRFGSEVCVLNLIVTSLKGDRVFGPKRFDEGERLVGACSPAVEILVQHLEFLLEPAHPQTKRETPAAELIHLGGLLGDFKRVVHWQDNNAGAQSQPGGLCREITEDGERLPVPLLPVFRMLDAGNHGITRFDLRRQNDVGTAPEGIDLKSLGTLCNLCERLWRRVFAPDHQRESKFHVVSLLKQVFRKDKV